jgi:hypothetical protein
MTVTITDGWLSGSLQDDTGKAWPIRQHRQSTSRPTLVDAPDLCLHTTETDGYVETLQFPSQWQTGAGVIGQHIRLGAAGDAVNDNDASLQQIEMVGRSKLQRWLPGEPTLGPTVALVAWLHRTGRIRTGLARPNASWPLVLDRGPQAVESYYRRKDGTWRKPGVYGHVEIPGNSHWDPGSFDYPVFFERVRRAIAVQEGTDVCVKCDELVEGLTAWRRGDPQPKEGLGAKLYAAFEDAASRPKPGAPGPHTHPHVHPVGKTGADEGA